MTWAFLNYWGRVPGLPPRFTPMLANLIRSQPVSYMQYNVM